MLCFDQSSTIKLQDFWYYEDHAHACKKIELE